MRNSLTCVCGLLALLGFMFDAGAQTPSGGTPIPTAVGPIPVTAESVPQMTVKRI